MNASTETIIDFIFDEDELLFKPSDWHELLPPRRSERVRVRQTPRDIPILPEIIHE